MDDPFVTISPAEFASYWGRSAAELPPELEAYLARADTSHRPLTGRELEDYLGLFVQSVTKKDARRAAEKTRSIFEACWADHLASLGHGIDLAALIPQYHNKKTPYLLGADGTVRFSRTALMSADMRILYMRYLALTVFKPFGAIHEFGSGSGLNLLALASTAPGKKVIGYEWADSGVGLADQIGLRSGLKVSGRPFNMLEPDHRVDIEGQAVLTMTAVEQLGENYDPFLDFLLAKKPAVVVNIETDLSTAVGPVYLQMAGLYTQLRGYPQGFTDRLRALEAEGRLAIDFFGRLPWTTSLGNNACTIWRPADKG